MEKRIKLLNQKQVKPKRKIRQTQQQDESEKIVKKNKTVENKIQPDSAISPEGL